MAAPMKINISFEWHVTLSPPCLLYYGTVGLGMGYELWQRRSAHDEEEEQKDEWGRRKRTRTEPPAAFVWCCPALAGVPADLHYNMVDSPRALSTPTAAAAPSSVWWWWWVVIQPRCSSPVNDEGTHHRRFCKFKHCDLNEMIKFRMQ